MKTNTVCPNCHTPGMEIFYTIEQVPVHSVVLLKTREQALNFTTGDIALGLCHHCGFVSNTAFDHSLHDYAVDYEATQSFSPTFNRFHTRLAQDIIDRHDLHDKTVIEIGCGQGEFLIMLAEMGPNKGIGFDPAYRNEPLETEAKDRLEFYADFYGEKYTHIQGDFVACKMTLEHIDQTLEFMQTVRRSIADQRETTVFFQIPNGEYVFGDMAFWDVYYEHCSYFTAPSLRYLFEQSGFDVLQTRTDYDDQYLMIEAKPGDIPTETLASPAGLADIEAQVANFKVAAAKKRADWQETLQGYARDGKKVAIWGGGSKGVAFLTTLGIHDQIPYIVDINPRKHGMYMAKTGQEIVSPEFLMTYQPDVVIVMNPIYCPEIQAQLDEMGIQAELVSV
ncbi:class I SAM-dependent methyltransferase [Phototrophicus methaneseepsis]|nr:class I SAM-dependent methyltransferase [Phototrophicus methaneseepsis]